MFRGLITPYSYTTGAPVAITQGFNTNAKYALENDKILIKSIGLTDIDATIVVEGTSGAVLTCTMKVNDQVYATVSFTVAEGSTYTFPFSEVVATQRSDNDEFVSVYFEFDGNCSITGGTVSAEYSE